MNAKTRDDNVPREATPLEEYPAPQGRCDTRKAKTHGLSRSLQSLWKRQIAPSVTFSSCRDHLALERTYLSYLRTSLALSFTAIIIAQLFRIQHSFSPDRNLGFFVLGVPLAAVCTAAAIVVSLIGFFRFWRQQNALLRGKVRVGGWELILIGILYFLVSGAVCL